MGGLVLLFRRYLDAVLFCLNRWRFAFPFQSANDLLSPNEGSVRLLGLALFSYVPRTLFLVKWLTFSFPF